MNTINLDIKSDLIKAVDIYQVLHTAQFFSDTEDDRDQTATAKIFIYHDTVKKLLDDMNDVDSKCHSYSGQVDMLKKHIDKYKAELSSGSDSDDVLICRIEALEAFVH